MTTTNTTIKVRGPAEVPAEAGQEAGPGQRDLPLRPPGAARPPVSRAALSKECTPRPPKGGELSREKAGLLAHFVHGPGRACNFPPTTSRPGTMGLMLARQLHTGLGTEDVSAQAIGDATHNAELNGMV
ncbi:uncharacterized protein LOC144168873 isoform X2 [Haemaphysalis longicornis]